LGPQCSFLNFDWIAEQLLAVGGAPTLFTEVGGLVDKLHKGFNVILQNGFFQFTEFCCHRLIPPRPMKRLSPSYAHNGHNPTINLGLWMTNFKEFSYGGSKHLSKQQLKPELSKVEKQITYG
jgi:hypothetical protein